MSIDAILDRREEAMSDVEHLFDGRRELSATFAEHSDCIEIIHTAGRADGQLFGYIIFFAGGWDAWLFNPAKRCLEQTGCNRKSVLAAASDLGITL